MPHDVPVLEVTQLRKQFALGRGWFRAAQSIRAVDGVSFRIGRGETLALVGESGCGKSTVANLLMQLTPPSSGEIRIGGEPVATHGTDALRQVWRQMQMVFQDPYASLNPRMRAHELVAEPLRNYGLGDATSRRQRAAELLDRVGLPPSAAKKRVGNYSLGMRQRLGIAQTLLGEPSVLILDEPANGLDPQGIHWMRELLRDFADRAGTVLLSSHLLREIEVIADDLIVIGDGKIMAQGSKAELLATTGTLVRAHDPEVLYDGLVAADLSATQAPDGALVVEAEPETVGRVAAELGCALIELRPADGGGLEQLFLTLTSTNRDLEEVAA